MLINHSYIAGAHRAVSWARGWAVASSRREPHIPHRPSCVLPLCRRTTRPQARPSAPATCVLALARSQGESSRTLDHAGRPRQSSCKKVHASWMPGGGDIQSHALRRRTDASHGTTLMAHAHTCAASFFGLLPVPARCAPAPGLARLTTTRVDATRTSTSRRASEVAHASSWACRHSFSLLSVQRHVAYLRVYRLCMPRVP